MAGRHHVGWAGSSSQPRGPASAGVGLGLGEKGGSSGGKIEDRVSSWREVGRESWGARGRGREDGGLGCLVLWPYILTSVRPEDTYILTHVFTYKRVDIYT